jgi:hypothetical protein
MAKPKVYHDWRVLSHEPLQKLADNLWWVRGTLPDIPLKRTMTIVRLDDGRLLFYSPIALDEASMREIEAWGRPAFLVVPNRGHRLDAPAYKKRYPELSVLAPKGAVPGVEQVVEVNSTFDDFPETGGVRFERLAGVKNDEEGVMFVRSADGVTVVLNDAMFNMQLPQQFFSRQIVRVLGSAPGPRVSRLVKLLFIDDKPAFRRALEQLAQTPQLVRVIVAHDSVASGDDARAALQKAATFV